MTDDLEVSPPETNDDPVAQAVAAVDEQVAQTPEAVRNTPEFRALEKQLRKSAREAGTARKAEQVARGEAESYRQAAEAERLAALETQLGALSPEVIAAYTELAELGQEDPVAAARRLAELLATPAQSGEQPAPPTASVAPPAGGTVPATAPKPLSGGADGNQPLTTPPSEDLDVLTGQLDDRYAAIVERNQGSETRNRVTMRERGEGMIAYLASAYLKALGKNG